jgi:peptidyl-prolyl cis-trans isomerase SurA
MMKTAIFAAGLLMAWPVLGQNPPAQDPAQEKPPAQEPTPAPQNPQAQEPAPQAPPTLEKPTESPESQEQRDADKKAEDKAAADKKAAAEAKKKEAAAPATPGAPAAAGAKPAKKVYSGDGKTVEEIIARVNNEIITQSELDKARNSAEEDARQDCANHCTPEQLQTAIAERQNHALRDLIDQSLLAQRGKDMGVSVETEVVKQLDQIRIANKLPDMDALEKAVTSQGINWDDFKNNIRTRALTQLVIGREVGSHITIGREEAKKYYEEHKSEFVRQEQVGLRAIEIKTEGKPESELPALKKKAESMITRVNDGEDFSELAKRFSDGSTAAQGGYLGVYKRGELSKEIEDKVFNMKKNEMTPVIETKQSYLILQVTERYEEGEQPFEKVEPEIMDHLYTQRMEPAMREYLKTLREQSYVVIKPGYQEMAGGGNSEIQEVNTTPEATKEKKGHKKYLLFGKNTSGDK